MAFGNGCSDIFSSWIAADDDRIELVISGLLGAGIFVTSVVVGIIFIRNDFKIQRSSIARDSFFYMLAVCLTWSYCASGEVSLMDSLTFIILYILYILVALLTQAVQVKRKKQISETQTPSATSIDMTGDKKLSISANIVDNKLQIEQTSLSILDQIRQSKQHEDQDDHLDVYKAVHDQRRGSLASIKVLSKVSAISGTVRERKTSKVVAPNLVQRKSINCIESTKVPHPKIVVAPPPPSSQQSQQPPTTTKTTTDTNSEKPKSDINNNLNKDKPKLVKVKVELVESKVTGNDKIDTSTNNELFVYQFNEQHEKDENTSDEQETKTTTLWLILQRVIAIFATPVYYLSVISIPVVDLEKHNNGWRRNLNSVHFVTAYLFALVSLKLFSPPIPIAAFFMALLCLAVMVRYFTQDEVEPKFHIFFAIFGFMMSVMAIYRLSKEVISVLKALGIFFGMSDIQIGIGILAWGNSLGDVVADTSLAAAGYPRMALSAAIGAPLLNLLIGFGGSFSLKLYKMGNHQSVPIESSKTISLLSSSLLLVLALIGSLAFLPSAVGSKLQRFLGYILISIYLINFSASIWLEMHNKKH